MFIVRHEARPEMLKIVCRKRPSLFGGHVQQPDLTRSRAVIARTGPMKPIPAINNRQLFSFGDERRHPRANNRLLRWQTELRESDLRTCKASQEGERPREPTDATDHCKDIPFHELSELSLIL